MSSTAPPHNDTRTAGRGGFAVLGAKVFFIIVGFAQQTLLPRLIGPAGYGALSRVLAITNIVNNVVITSSIQGVSRAVAQTPADRAGEALRRAFKTHVALAIPLALLFFFFAPVYATFQHAEHIVRPLQIVSVVVLAYGLYAPLVGALNGQRRFSLQAGLDITYATLRTAGLLGLGWILSRSGYGLIGACIGFALAAVLILPAALAVAGLGKPGTAGPSVKDHLTFLAPVAFGQIAVQLLMQSDISLLGRFASELVDRQGLVGEAARTAADKMVGAYRACQLFAFLPFQLLISITFILFPMLAKASAEHDRDAIARYVRTGMRLAFLLACVMVSTVVALAPHLLRLAFPTEFADAGASALRVLALGQGAFAIFYVETTVLTSLGRERLSAALTAVAVVLVLALCWIAGSSASSGPGLLLRTGAATSLALAAAAVAGAVAVRKTTRAFVRPVTFARVVLALAVTVAVGARVPWLGKLMVIPCAAAIAAGVVLLLIATGELARTDARTLVEVIRRRKSG